MTPPRAKPKMPRPSRKNSRFSGKNSGKRVRLTWRSSTSTCAKSVFQVKSAVRFWVMPYLTSMPTSPLRSLSSTGDAVRSVVTPPMAYGLTSRVRLTGGGSRPTRDPAADTRKMPAAPLPPPAEIGRRVR